MRDIRKNCNLSCSVYFQERKLKGLLSDISYLGGRIHFDLEENIGIGTVFDLEFSVNGDSIMATCISLNKDSNEIGFQFLILTPIFRDIIDKYIGD